MNQAHQTNAGASSGSIKSYATGFVLSIVLTLIPFMLVMTGALSHSAIVFCIFATAILQIFVQLHYFLHLDTSSAMHWNLMSLLFTFFIIFLFVGGSIWIMYSLHYRM
ncbi:cytochrome o ubiquinol oxidase subunit IV [Fundidesulfovibrio terrae]|uniref:cytochrome o ubiquinol oxidase subunit IV n=1 Tax=Fundidesulfovibrio terrae TaxID=2922866 RepID=UPI001FAEDA7E|nr:cytochrome o ubiquinol oxidase subunit IV [Fundidesulfovibrio terrae]